MKLILAVIAAITLAGCAGTTRATLPPDQTYFPRANYGPNGEPCGTTQFIEGYNPICPQP